MTARCRVSLRIPVWLVALILPAWTRHLCQTRATAPASRSLCSPPASWPCFMLGFGELWEGRSSGEGWRRRGEWIADGQKKGREMGTSPSVCIVWMLIATPRVFTPSYLYPLLKEESAALQPGSESLLLPQVGKPRINSGAAGRGNAVPSKPRTEETLPRLVRPTNPSHKALCVCVNR